MVSLRSSLISNKGCLTVSKNNWPTFRVRWPCLWKLATMISVLLGTSANSASRSRSIACRRADGHGRSASLADRASSSSKIFSRRCLVSSSETAQRTSTQNCGSPSAFQTQI